MSVFTFLSLQFEIWTSWFKIGPEGNRLVLNFTLNMKCGQWKEQNQRVNKYSVCVFPHLSLLNPGRPDLGLEQEQEEDTDWHFQSQI